MKKIFVLLLVAVMCLTITSCGKEAELYNKYKDVIDALENEDYQGAVAEIYEMYQNAEATNTDGEETEDPAITELKESLNGEWLPNVASVDNYEAVFFTVSEDGSFVMGEEKLSLILKDTYADEVVYNAHKDGANVYRLSIRKNDKGNVYINLGRYIDEYSSEGMGIYYRASDYTKVDLTMDNWQDYFEFGEYISQGKNSFDEITSLYVKQLLKLKADYVINAELSAVALEYSTVYRWYDMTADLEAGTYAKGEMSEGSKNATPSTNTGSMRELYETEVYGCDFGSFSVDGAEDDAPYYDDFTMIRIAGSIYLAKGE